MTAALLERVPVERITYQAQHASPRRTVLAVIAGTLFGLGYLLRRSARLGWVALAWGGVAFREGWREGGRHAAARRPG